MQNSEIIISCVGEDQEDHHRKVLTLVRSLRAFGGNLAKTRFIAVFIETLKPSIQQELTEIGAKIRIVERFDSRCPHANKLRMLELDDDYDVLVALDVDIAIVGDFSSKIDSHSFGAKIVDSDPLDIPTWQKLFDFANVPMPTIRVNTTSTASMTIPYFNSGVLFIPKVFVHKLRERWGWRVKDLLGWYPQLPELKQHRFYTDQFALAIAAAELGLPLRLLPLELNFPTHTTVHQTFFPERINPSIIHYHSNLAEDGSLRQCQYHNTNELIGKLNELIHSRRQSPDQDFTQCLLW